MRTIPRLVVASLLLGLLATVAAPPKKASAHPMGNFTINHYSALTLGPERLDVLYIVDMAEIPAYQELGTIRADKSTNLTPAEREAYTTRKAAELAPGLVLAVNGRVEKLTLEGSPQLSFPPGVGGLPTLRIELKLWAPLDAVQSGTLEYRDDNYKERIGWKEIVAVPGEGVSLEGSSVPAADLSDQLRSYPPDRINDPPRDSYATLSYSVTGAAAATRDDATGQPQLAPTSSETWGSLDWVKQQTDALSAVMTQRDLPLGALFTALIIAFSIGAAHALSPGHGKTVVAAYLVGSRGTALHALLLGVTVTVSHTLGVFLLGFVVLYLANFILPEALYPWLSFISGMMLAAMGITLFVQRMRAWRAGRSRTSAPAALQAHSHGDGHNHDHDHNHSHGDAAHSHEPHTHDGHTHAHDHDHNHNHNHDDASVPHKHGPFGTAHTHVPADGQRVTLGSLLVLGISGGIIPCPSALVVLLVAVASGQVALGLTLILAFSLGLAAVLVAIGLLMVYSRQLLNRFRFGSSRFGGVMAGLPVLSALAVSILGLLISLRAFTTG